MLNPNDLTTYLDPNVGTTPKINLPPVTVNPNVSAPVADNGWEDIAKTMIDSATEKGLEQGNRYKGGTEYDAAMNQGADQQELRGQMQTGWQKIRRGALSRTASVVPKLIQGLGHVGGFVGDIATGFQNGYTFDNPLVREMSEMDDGFNDNVLGIDTRIYNTARYTTGSLLDQLGTSEFWAKDAFDGVAFLASALIPGMAAGKIAKLAAGMKALKLGEAINTGLKEIEVGQRMGVIAKVLETGKIGDTVLTAKQLSDLQGLVKGVQNLTVGATSAYNTISEAGFEAFDTGKQLRDELSLKKYGQAFEDLPSLWQKEIKDEVAPRQMETFLWNTAILAGPNYIQSKFFFGKPHEARSVVKSIIGTGVTDAEELAKQTGEKYTGTLTKSIAQDVATGIASEGLWEEGIQTAIQDYEARKAKGLTDSNQVAGIIDSYIDGYSTIDGQKSMFLGGLLGGFGGIVGGFREYKEKQLEANKALAFEKSHLSVMSNIRQQYQDNLAKPVKGYDENNQPIYDDQALSRSVYNTLNEASRFNESMAANLKADNLHAGFVNREALSELAYKRFSDPYFDSMDEAEAAINTDLAHIAAQSETPEHTKEVLAEHKKAITDLRKIYEAVETSLPAVEELMTDEHGKLVPDPGKQDFMELVKTNLFYEKMKKEYLQNSGFKDKSGADFTSLMEDIDSKIDRLTDRTKRSELLMQYKQYQDQNFQDLQTLRDEKATPEAKDLARYNINKRAFLNGSEHTADSLFLQGSEALESRLGKKVAEARKMYYTRAMQGIIKNRLTDSLQDLKDNKITPSEFLTKLQSDYEYITPDMEQQVREGMKEVLDKQESLKQQLTDLTSQVNTAQSEFDNTEEDTPEFYMAQQDLQDVTKAKNKVDAELKEITTKNAMFEDLANLTADSSEYSNRVDAAFKNNTVAELEQAIYASNFTDDNGTVMPSQAAKLISQLSKDSEEDMIADPSQVDSVIAAFEQQKKLFSTDDFKDILKDPNFNYFVDRYFKAFKQAYPSIDLKSFDYLQNLTAVMEALNSLKQILKNNKDSRQQRQTENYQMDSEVKFRGIGFAKDGSAEHSESTQFIEKVIGKDVMDKLIKEAKSHGMEYPYAEVLMQKFKAVASDEQISDLKKIMESRKASFVDQLELLTGHSKKLLHSYLHNPLQAILTLLTHTNVMFSGDEMDNDPASPAYKFKKTSSLSELVRAMGTDTKIDKDRKERINKVIEIHKQVSGIESIFDMLDSEVVYQDQVTSDFSNLEEDKKLPFLPTYQQLSAIRGIARFLKLPVDRKNLSAFCTLLGRAGSGKTTMVLSRVFRSLGIKPDEILVSATNPHAVETVGKALGTTGIQFEELLKTDLHGKKVIILDEAAAITDDQFEALMTKITTYNNSAKDQDLVRVIFAGDPNQITNSQLTQPTITRTVELRGVDYASIKKIPPLTIAYRSDVSAINSFADEFIDNTKPIQGIYATASDDLNDLNEKTVGVYVDSRDKIADTAKKLWADSAGKISVAIIVDTEATKSEYQAMKLPDGIEILTYIESQGRTIDKVLIDITRSKIGKMSDLDFNRVMYTAVTRAKRLAFVANNTGTFKQTIDKSTTENADARAKDISANASWYVDHIRKENGIVGELIEGKKPTDSPPAHITTAITTVTSEPVVEEEETGETYIPPEEELPQEIPEELPQAEPEVETAVVKAEQDHKAKFPENLSKEDLKDLKPKGKVKYVKVRYDDTDRIGILILAETKDGKYRKVGEVQHFGTPEADLPQWLMKALDSMSGTEAVEIKKKQLYINDFTEDEINNSTLAEGTLKRASRLNYQYESKDRGKGIIDKVLTLWNKNFKLDDKIPVSITARIFTKKELGDKNFNRFKFGHLKAGVPYLIIEGGGLNSIQYIEMTPAPIHTDTKGVKELTTLRDAVKRLQDAGIGTYGEKNFNNAVRYFHQDFVPQGNNVVFSSHVTTIEQIQKYLPTITYEQFKLLQNESLNIIPAYFGVSAANAQLLVNEDSASLEQYRHDASDGTQFKIEPSNIKGKVKISWMRPGETVFTPYVKPHLVAGKGKAQYLIQDITARHPDIVMGEVIPLIRKSGKEENVSSLLSEKSFVEKRGHAAIRQEFKNQQMRDYGHSAEAIDKLLEGRSDQELETAILNSEPDPARREAIRKRFEFLKATAVETNINMDVLNEILTFDANGESETLQQNIQMDPFNDMGKKLNEKKESLDALLASNFSGIEVPEVIVSPNQESNQFPPDNTTASDQAVPVVDDTVFEENQADKAKEKTRSRARFSIVDNTQSLNGYSTTASRQARFDKYKRDNNLCP